MIKLTEENVSLARAGHRRLRERIANSAATAPRVFIGFGNSDEVTLPPQAVAVLADVLEQLADGKEPIVTAYPAEMTTQQAADYLRVSRPFLVRLLDENAIPSRKVGTHRRVLRNDLEAYKERDDARRLKILEELTEQAQELKMGY